MGSKTWARGSKTRALPPRRRKGVKEMKLLIATRGGNGRPAWMPCGGSFINSIGNGRGGVGVRRADGEVG
jgi:hypothetical protein